MRIVTKRTRVILMTEEELRMFHELMERAHKGTQSHYAEEQLDDGSFLGVSVVKDTLPPPRPHHVAGAFRNNS